MSKDYSQLLIDKSDQEGALEFTVDDAAFFDPDVKEVTLFYNVVGQARFKLFRNNKMELVLVHVTDDWMRQAKIDISKYQKEIRIAITWDKNEDKLAVKGSGESEYYTVKAMQIDN